MGRACTLVGSAWEAAACTKAWDSFCHSFHTCHRICHCDTCTCPFPCPTFSGADPDTLVAVVAVAKSSAQLWEIQMKVHLLMYSSHSTHRHSDSLYLLISCWPSCHPRSFGWACNSHRSNNTRRVDSIHRHMLHHLLRTILKKIFLCPFSYLAQTNPEVSVASEPTHAVVGQ